MDAVISGRAGKALLLDGDFLQSFDVDDPSRLVSRRQSDLPYLFGESQDLRVLENTDLESIRQELQHDCDCNWALDVTLISLDAELPDDIRKEAIEGLNELLDSDRVIERLENILYARPLPDDADLQGALKLADGTPLSKALLQSLEERQPSIVEVSQAWDTIPSKMFGGYEQQAEFHQVAVREGLFRALVIVLETKGAISTFILNTSLKDSIKQLRNYRQVLQQWSNPFKQLSDAPQIKREIEEEFEPETSPRRRHGRRTGINREAILREVNKKKAFITEAMRRRDLGRVHELIDDLISYHLNNSESVHTAKSLCDLAMEAKELGMYPLQLELTERSTNIAPDDAWSWAQYGDALLNMQRLDDALRAHHQADAFGAGVIAKTGQAEVLKAKGKLDEALVAYDEAIALHPENVVAKNGRAEVLKAKGKMDDALAAFNKVIALYPENIVAKNGRAEVLKAKGRLDEALVAFNEVIALHPENIVAKTGRAEVLKAQGKLDEALAAFNKVIALHPESVIAKTGRAEVLKAQGKLDEALAAYNEAVVLHPENNVAKRGRAELLKAKGQLEDALAAYNLIIALYPEDVVARNGRSYVLAALERYAEALESLPSETPTTLQDWIGYHIRGMILLRMGNISEAIRIFEQGVQNNPWSLNNEYFRTALAIASLRNREFRKATEVLSEVTAPLLQPQANVLRLHSFGALDETEQATAAYQSLETKPWSISDELVDELHRRYILKEEPQRSDEWVFDQEDNMILLVASQQAMSSSSLSY
jgi:tetratricopeptide (TPR) repeat protein